MSLLPRFRSSPSALPQLAQAPLRSRALALVGMISLLSGSGCVSYEPEPLLPADELARALALREPARENSENADDGSTGGAGELRLARVWTLAKTRSPDLLDGNATARIAQARAETPIPLPNPELTVGPILLPGSAIPSDHRWGFEAALGWWLDLSGSRAAGRSVVAAEGALATTQAAVTERTALLQVRQGFVELAHAEQRHGLHVELADSLERSLDVARRLVDAAQATALDVRSFEIERHLARAAAMEAAEETDASRAALARVTGLTPVVFRAPEQPHEPSVLPALPELRTRLLRDHPELALLRAAYDLAESQLRQAICAARPDLGLEPSVEREEDQEKYGLGLGIEIPIFDRNQPEIADRTAARAAARQAYRSALSRQLTDIEAARSRIERRRLRRALLADEALPAAQSAVALAARSLHAGQTDALQFLTVARAERSVRLELLAAQEAVLLAWSELEAACGSPLLVFESMRAPETPSPTAPPVSTPTDDAPSAGGSR